MGMFDRLRVHRNGKEVEIQFKVYMGQYEPDLRDCRLGEVIPGLPRCKFAELSYADSGDCIVEFNNGAPVRVIWPPETEGYMFPDLPRPKHHPERKELVEEEHCKRNTKRLMDLAGGDPTKVIGIALAEPLKRMIDYEGFARMIFRPKSKYPNHDKINGKWRRIRPVE